MTAPTPPLPELLSMLRMCADWQDPDCSTVQWKERYGVEAWNAMGTGTAEREFAVALRAAADRLEAEQPAPDWISLQQLRHELGEERDEKAKQVAELQRLRDENEKLREQSESLARTIVTHNTAHAAAANQWRDRAEWLLGEMRKEADRG